MLHSAPPRGPRAAPNSSRGGRGRGGIQKRRTDGPARVDKDGDLVMDAVASGIAKRGAGKGRVEPAGKPGGNRRTTSGSVRGGSAGIHRSQAAILRGMGAQQANILESRIIKPGASLQIEGLTASKAATNTDGGLDALLGFLERKATKSNRAVKIKKSHKRGDKVIITASQEDITEIQKLDGFSFAGVDLIIKPYESAPPQGRTLEKKEDVSPEALEIKAKFQQVLASRYNPELKLLNLSALATDPGLVEMGLFNGDTNTKKVFPALMAVCDSLFKTRAEKKEALVSVTLTDNSLTNVADINPLVNTFPDIKNIDLSRNNLADIKALDAWRYKVKGLENLLLAENPIEAQLPTLKDEFVKRYQRLAILSNMQVRSPEEIALIHAKIEAAKSPLVIAGPDFRDVSQVGENFVRQFLASYDTNKDVLLSTYYDNTSVFSLSVNMTAPRPHDGTSVSPWNEYIKHSRNAVKITHTSARMNRSYRGVEAIKGCWASIPPTRHPELMQTDKYIIECHTVQGLPDPSGQSPSGVDGLTITINGEFEEATAEKAMRSFSRTFILGPGAPGIQPIRVISDMLALRAYGPLAHPQQPTMATPPQQSVQMAMQQQQQPIQIAMSEQQKQEALAMQLMEKTGMTLQYAALCLGETGWNLEMALNAFLANKDKLPADAFQRNVAL